METMTAGLFLPVGTGVEPEPVIVGGLESLNLMVGGTIDAVTTTLGEDTGCVIVGYINDDGIALDLDFNYIASALFGRQIVGDCVIVWGLNEDGEYDGHNHDLPTAVANFVMTELMAIVAKGYGVATLLSSFCEIAIEFGIAEQEDVDYHSEQLMLSAQMGRYGEEHDSHIDYFINMVGEVLNRGPEVDRDEDDTQVREWGRMLLDGLTAQKGRH